MPVVDLKPADLGQSGWNEILPRRKPRAALEQDIECDYLVVGAGFAGLAAARRLRQLEADASIVVLEAREVAAGPAGRNSGFMIDLPHALTSGGYAGDRSSDLRNIAMNRAAIDFAAEAAREYGFAAEAFDPCGKINAAAG
ncbi:MAG: FAD-dependent oxidoreductase, partial [Gammaproteobacteria bacterium]